MMRNAYRVWFASNRRTASLPLPAGRGQLKDVAQAEAGPVCAGNGGESQDEKDDQDDHPTAAACTGATTPKAETLLQPIEGGGQQKEFEKSL
jgi:hypothetical protein